MRKSASRSAHLLQKGCAQQQLAHLRRLALEHLGHEIAATVRSLPVNSLTKRSGSGCFGERECRQPQPGHPALGPFVQQRHGLVVERDAVRLQQLARLVEREAQVGRADLGQPVGQAQAMQTQPRILACRQRHTQPRREFAQEALEQAQRVGGPELMEVVDDQDEWLVERAQVGQQALDDGLAAERRGGAHAFDEPLPADRIGHRIDHRQPEVLRVLFVALDRDPRDPAAKPFGPGSQEDRLPAAGRRADEQHAPWPPADSAPNTALRGTSRRAADERSSVAVCASNAFILRLPAAGPTLPSDVPHNQGVRAANAIAHGAAAAACGRPAFQDRSGRIDRAARIAAAIRATRS